MDPQRGSPAHQAPRQRVRGGDQQAQSSSQIHLACLVLKNPEPPFKKYGHFRFGLVSDSPDKSGDQAARWEPRLEGHLSAAAPLL